MPIATPPADIRRLSDLLEVSQTLGSTLNLRSSLAKVFEVLEESHGLISGMVALRDETAGDLAVEAATGVPGARDARYRVGEGITGRAVQSGQPVAAPKAGREPLFRNPTA